MSLVYEVNVKMINNYTFNLYFVKKDDVEKAMDKLKALEKSGECKESNFETHEIIGFEDLSIHPDDYLNDKKNKHLCFFVEQKDKKVKCFYRHNDAKEFSQNLYGSSVSIASPYNSYDESNLSKKI